MNKMVRNLVKVAAIGAASVLILASCSKKDINASREMEERYSRASAEIENSAPRPASGSVQKVEEVEVVTPASVEATTPVAVQPEVVTGTTKTAKHGFVQRAVEKTVMKKMNRFVEKHPELKQKYQDVQSLDPNLKMAIIFAIIAVILGIIAGISGPVSWLFWLLSVVAWLVALYFLIMWIMTL